MKPGQAGVTMVPINRMVPRSFITNLGAGARMKAHAPAKLRGLAMGGDCGVAKVEVSADGGQSWHDAKLGKDEGAYSFRQWTAQVADGRAGRGCARGPLHQHQRRGAARHAELESVRLHAQCGRTPVRDVGLRCAP